MEAKSLVKKLKENIMGREQKRKRTLTNGLNRGLKVEKVLLHLEKKKTKENTQKQLER